MQEIAALAAVRYEARFQIDDFIADVARVLAAEGARLGGVIQENEETAREDGSCCATMRLVDLRARERFTISQDLGPDSRGCRLDPRGLAEVESRLDAATADDIDLLILNKFGRAEAEGRGLRAIFARAIEAGVPILTAVRAPYDEVWQDFHGGLSADLPADPAVVLAWCRARIAMAAARRADAVAP